MNTSDDFWIQSCNNNSNKSTKTNVLLIQYKVIHSVHYTGARLHKVGLNESDKCIHGSQNTIDTYLHGTRDCSPIWQFWLQVTKQLSRLVGCQISPFPQRFHPRELRHHHDYLVQLQIFSSQLNHQEINLSKLEIKQ